MQKNILLTLIAFVFCCSGNADPSAIPIKNTNAGATRSPASVSDSSKALEVRGQSRNLSMLLVLKNRKNDIDFVKPRVNYNNEIKNTGY